MSEEVQYAMAVAGTPCPQGAVASAHGAPVAALASAPPQAQTNIFALLFGGGNSAQAVQNEELRRATVATERPARRSAAPAPTETKTATRPMRTAEAIYNHD